MEQDNFGARWLFKFQVLLFAAFLLACLLVWSWLWQLGIVSNHATWPVGLLAVLAIALTFSYSIMELPIANVLWASLLIGILGGMVQAVELRSGGFSLHKFVYFRQDGNAPFPRLAWVAPLIWIVVLLNARGIARLMVRRLRHEPNYGLWVMGITIILSAMWQESFDFFVANVTGGLFYPYWYNLPAMRFFAWAATSLLTLLLVTPILIDKTPQPKEPALQPLFVWLLLSWLLMSAAWVHQLWYVLFLMTAQGTVTAIFALLGACRPANPTGNWN
jgi:hypothetical protein